MSAYYNLGSIILGLISCIVPIVGLVRYTNNVYINNRKLSFLSFSSCLLSLCLQIFEIKHRVNIQDWSALVDTIDVLAVVVVIFIIIVMLLNIVLVTCYNKNNNI